MSIRYPFIFFYHKSFTLRFSVCLLSMIDEEEEEIYSLKPTLTKFHSFSLWFLIIPLAFYQKLMMRYDHIAAQEKDPKTQIPIIISLFPILGLEHTYSQIQIQKIPAERLRKHKSFWGRETNLAAEMGLYLPRVVRHSAEKTRILETDGCRK
eukprot:TRINITY_DN4005_c0_g1_i10.p1 TRINITY_DN4005_c0_g1~~TRINITY_DN4005_c0_g1_i10.p1  ORF type:complete len:152 (-),score=14.94 TRINITY_DN4005_c0_g1_i10:434-889(-)